MNEFCPECNKRIFPRNHTVELEGGSLHENCHAQWYSREITPLLMKQQEIETLERLWQNG